jgi:RHS repeat-associated protein
LLSSSLEDSTGFTGERQDPETGLVYLHSRYYDPSIGRFLSADPTHPSQPGVGTNRYAYAGNDPINRVDNGGAAWVSVEVHTAFGIPYVPHVRTTIYYGSSDTIQQLNAQTPAASGTVATMMGWVPVSNCNMDCVETGDAYRLAWQGYVPDNAARSGARAYLESIPHFATHYAGDPVDYYTRGQSNSAHNSAMKSFGPAVAGEINRGIEALGYYSPENYWVNAGPPISSNELRGNFGAGGDSGDGGSYLSLGYASDGGLSWGSTIAASSMRFNAVMEGFRHQAAAQNAAWMAADSQRLFGYGATDQFGWSLYSAPAWQR